jgi:hypothetical protein
MELIFRLLTSILLVIGLMAPASADLPIANYAAFTTTTATVIKYTPGIFYGVIPLASQTTIITCWDNTVASGQAIYINTPTINVNTAYYALGQPIRFTIGLICQIATSIVAPGFLVLYN